MYTPFEGLEFLQAYVTQRQSMYEELAEVRQHLLRNPSTETEIAEEIREAAIGASVEVGPRPLRVRQPMVLPAQPGDGEFQTREALLDIWRCFVHDPPDATQTCTTWLSFLLKRFEVSKRLHIGYTASLKPVQTRLIQAENYPLLAALLMLEYQSNSSLKYLNAVLKLLDLAASIAPPRRGPLAQLVSLVAVEMELAAMKTLIADHEITL